MRLAFLTTILFLVYHSVCGQWVELNEGLYGGPAFLFLYHNGTLYTGTEGGVFRTTDDGENWQRLNQGFVGEVHVNALAECNGEIFVATNGGQRLYKLNGSVWEIANSGLPEYATIRLVSVSNILFAMTNQGDLYKSTDQGASWFEIATPFNYITSLAVSGSSLVIGTENGVFLSGNNGQSWVEKSTGLTSKKIISLDASDDYLICWTQSGTVFFSKDGGNLWTAPGLPGDYLTISSKGTTVIARSVFTSHISYNSGSTWSTLNQVPLGPGSIFIDQNIFVGTYYGVYRSGDGGVTWNTVNNGLKNNIIYNFTEAFGSIFVATQTGVYRSTNDGALWTRVSNGLPVARVLGIGVHGNTLVAGVLEHGIYASTDEGLSWTKVLSTISGAKIFVPYNGKLLAGGGEGIFQSADGLSWSVFSSPLVAVSDLKVINTRLWAVASTGISFSDNGTTWTTANDGLPDLSVIPVTLHPVGNHLLLGTWNSSVYRKQNSTGPWQPASAGIIGNGNECFSSIGSSVFVGGNGGVFKTTDIASTWSAMNEGLPISLYNELKSLHAHGERLFAGTYGFGVWAMTLPVTPCSKPATPSVVRSGEDCTDVRFVSSSNTGNQWYLNGDIIPGAIGKEYVPLVPGEYKVNVGSGGCVSNFSSPLEFELAAEAVIEMPNIFTPNGDDDNPAFMPLTFEGIESAALTIYDRYGQAIYNTEDLQKGWDGDGKPTGVYYYYISYKACGGNESLKGWVQLAR